MHKGTGIKILFAPCHYVYESEKRGSEYRHAFEIADSLSKIWPDSVVITGKITQNNPSTYRVVEVQPKKTVYEMSTLPATIFLLRYTYAAIQLLRKDKFDVIHHVRPFKLGITFNLLALLGFTRNKLFIIGSFSMPYDDDANTYFGRYLKKLLAPLSYRTLAKADMVVVYDNATRNMVSPHVSRSKIKLITPGVDGKRFQPSQKKQYRDDIRIISVGYLIPRKRFDYLIECFSILVTVHPNARLTIYGDGPERDNLINLIKSLKLSNKIRLAGFVENSKLHNVYKNADIFALLQEEESFGQVYLEAMASGLPTITTNNTGAKLVINEENGFIIPHDNKELFVKTISSLIEDRKLLRDLSESSRKQFEKKYDSHIITKEWHALYKDLLYSRGLL